LTIIGIGEDGLAGLSDASRKALAGAETVFGGERHLKLAEIGGRGKPWPVPFDASCVLSRREIRREAAARAVPERIA
jgi:precorrin-6Y C5,15-methyltransferase (decarboxylating)